MILKSYISQPKKVILAHMENNNNEEEVFSQETIDTLFALGRVLEKINQRMIDEGYHIVDGKIVNIETGEEWKRKK